MGWTVPLEKYVDNRSSVSPRFLCRHLGCQRYDMGYDWISAIFTLIDFSPFLFKVQVGTISLSWWTIGPSSPEVVCDNVLSLFISFHILPEYRLKLDRMTRTPSTHLANLYMGGYCLFRGTSHLFNMIPGKHISWLRLPSTLIINLEAPTEYWSTIPHLQGWTFNTKLDAFKAQYPSNHSGRKFRPFQKISCEWFPALATAPLWP